MKILNYSHEHISKNLSSDWEIFSPIFPEIIMIHLDIYGFNFLNTGKCVGAEGVFIA